MEMIDFNPEEKGEVTILDVLDVDLCRDAILDHVHIRDIVRSERVCRRWRRAVLDYLPRCRNLTLSIYQRSRVYNHSLRTVVILDDGTFPVRHVLEKFGPLITSLYTNRCDEEFYEHIATFCPSLQQIDLANINQKRAIISEQELGSLFHNLQLQKIKLRFTYFGNESIKVGYFLKQMNLTKLKSLSLIGCLGFRYAHLEPTASGFRNVTRLEIFSMYYFRDMLRLMENMPKLENLIYKGSLDSYEFVECCSQLDHLKSIHLIEHCDYGVNNDYEVNDNFLKGLASTCKKLEYLNVPGSIKTPYGHGLAALVIRPSPGASVCFARVRSADEDEQALFEYLRPLNNELKASGCQQITQEMLKQAFKSKAQDDLLELSLTQTKHTMEMIDFNPEEKGEVTILGVLDVDLCRDAILDHVHIRDIVRSERVCRRWQRAVLDYLPRCRNLTLSIYQRSRVYKHSLRTVMIRDDGTFPVRHILEKLGFFIVSLYTNRSDPEFYDAISSYCPRLRHIELKRLSTRGPNNISEQKLGRAFQNIELEKVKLVKCWSLDGKILHLMNLSSLKTLSLINSEFTYKHIRKNMSRLYNVTSLEIVTPYPHFEKFMYLIDNMPKLENIFVKGFLRQYDLVEHCSRFKHLKRIDMREIDASNEYLEGLASVCQNLEYLNIASSVNSPCGRGLAALVIRPSPGTLLCFTRIRKVSLGTLLEFLAPFNDALAAQQRKKLTLGMLSEASKSIEQYDSLELRLAYPVVRNAKLFPELKIILNVSFVRN